MKITFPSFSFICGMLLTLAFSLSYECTVPYHKMIGNAKNHNQHLESKEDQSKN